MKFKNIYEFKEFNSMININLDGIKTVFYLDYDETLIPFVIKLYKDGILYDDLNVTIPESYRLNRKEFFLNPNINKNIVKELVKQNFMEETYHDAVAGDMPTKSYILTI